MSSWASPSSSARRPPALPHEPAPIRGWAMMPGHTVPVTSFGIRATPQELVSWAQANDRRLRAGILEWILMDLMRGEEFIKRISNNPNFRSKFSGYFPSTSAVMVRLGAPEPKPPLFFLEKIEKVKKALEVEEKWLEAARCELKEREVRIDYLRTTLDQACSSDWDSIGFKSRIPALPPQQPTRRIKEQPRLIWTNAANRDSRKWKWSSSHAPRGVKRPASSRMDTGDVEDRRETTELSRKPQREWPRSGSVSRRRSESRAPSATRVYRDRDEHRSLGRVSKGSAKKGLISELLYDTVQEEHLLVRYKTGSRSVEYALEARPLSDHSQGGH